MPLAFALLVLGVLVYLSVSRATRRPVSGITCIKPYAFADDLISAVNVDSCAMSAAIRNGSRSCACEYFLISDQ